jgi:hypothetical protein
MQHDYETNVSSARMSQRVQKIHQVYTNEISTYVLYQDAKSWMLVLPVLNSVAGVGKFTLATAPVPSLPEPPSPQQKIEPSSCSMAQVCSFPAEIAVAAGSPETGEKVEEE